jgi:hypothetical protein
MQIGNGAVGADEQATPNQPADVAQHDAQLVDDGLAICDGFRHRAIIAALALSPIALHGFPTLVHLGVCDRIWALVQELCEELDGCDWRWQSADTSMGKARMGGTSSARIPPTVPSRA